MDCEIVAQFRFMKNFSHDIRIGYLRRTELGQRLAIKSWSDGGGLHRSIGVKNEPVTKPSYTPFQPQEALACPQRL